MSVPRLTSVVATVLWASVCAWLLLTPGRGLPPISTWGDKAGHFALFLVQAWLLRHALRTGGALRPALWAAVVTMLYAAALELAHLWVPGRSWELLDLIAGAAGALVATVMVRRAAPASL